MATQTQILVGRKQAAELLGLGVRTFDRLSAGGMLGPRGVRLGGSLRFNLAELTDWAASGENGRLPNRDSWRWKADA